MLSSRNKPLIRLKLISVLKPFIAHSVYIFTLIFLNFLGLTCHFINFFCSIGHLILFSFSLITEYNIDSSFYQVIADLSCFNGHTYFKINHRLICKSVKMSDYCESAFETCINKDKVVFDLFALSFLL